MEPGVSQTRLTGGVPEATVERVPDTDSREAAEPIDQANAPAWLRWCFRLIVAGLAVMSGVRAVAQVSGGPAVEAVAAAALCLVFVGFVAVSATTGAAKWRSAALACAAAAVVCGSEAWPLLTDPAGQVDPPSFLGGRSRIDSPVEAVLRGCVWLALSGLAAAGAWGLAWRGRSSTLRAAEDSHT